MPSCLTCTSVLVASVACWVQFRSPIEPVVPSFKISPLPALAPDDRLAGARHIFRGNVSGPESFAASTDALYSGLADGRIIRLKKGEQTRINPVGGLLIARRRRRAPSLRSLLSLARERDDDATPSSAPRFRRARRRRPARCTPSHICTHGPPTTTTTVVTLPLDRQVRRLDMETIVAATGVKVRGCGAPALEHVCGRPLGMRLSLARQVAPGCELDEFPCRPDEPVLLVVDAYLGLKMVSGLGHPLGAFDRRASCCCYEALFGPLDDTVVWCRRRPISGLKKNKKIIIIKKIK